MTEHVFRPLKEDFRLRGFLSFSTAASLSGEPFKPTKIFRRTLQSSIARPTRRIAIKHALTKMVSVYKSAVWKFPIPRSFSLNWLEMSELPGVGAQAFARLQVKKAGIA